MKRYILEIIVFICGASLMIYELVGSRLLAPYLGSGIFVWSSIIGVILGSLSLGYWIGGKIADKKASLKKLSIIITVLAFSVGMTIFYKDGVLLVISNLFGLKVGSVLASLVLFSSSSVLFGIISPYATILKLKGSLKTGETIGSLYAISTAGSIFGTFFAGFFLIPTFGSVNILIIITIILFSLSIFSFFENVRYFIVFIVFLLSLLVFNHYSKINNSISDVNEDIDTQYSRILVYDFKNIDGDIVRVLKTNPSGVQSHMLVSDPNKMLTTYGEVYDLGAYLYPDFKEALLLGGGGYSYPKHFLEKFTQANLDVVEIDPGMTAVAKKYFYFKESPKINIFHEDARVFLNKNQKKYDVIFKDTFNNSYSIPFQLTTEEVIRREFDSLGERGVIFVNIIGATKGKNSLVLNLEYNTYKAVFPKVFLFKVVPKAKENDLQNFVLVALKSNKEVSFNVNDEEMQEVLDKKIDPQFDIKNDTLKDDFAPVDYYSLNAVF